MQRNVPQRDPIMILFISSFVIFLYVTASLFLFSSCRSSLQWISIALLFIISQKYLVYNYLGGAFFAPALPRPFLLLMEALYGALLIFFVMLLLKDLLVPLLRRSGLFGIPGPFPFSMAGLKAGLAVLALALGVWGTWQAVRVPDIRTVELRLPSLPRSLDGFSIVQLTDTHIGPLLKKEWLRQVVDKANSLSPDLILLTGDYIDGTVAALREEVTPFAGLRATYGVYGVTGNHEYYWGAAEWSALMQALQVTMLHNEHRVLTIGNEKLVIAGMPDRTERAHGGEGPDIEATMEGAPEVTRILLAHQPRDAASCSRFADVQLSGHTHGGTVFFLKPLVALFNKGFVQGLYDLDGKKLYVSPGTGIWNGFSCRIGVPAEMTHIILRAADTPA